MITSFYCAIKQQKQSYHNNKKVIITVCIIMAITVSLILMRVNTQNQINHNLTLQDITNQINNLQPEDKEGLQYLFDQLTKLAKITDLQKLTINDIFKHNMQDKNGWIRDCNKAIAAKNIGNINKCIISLMANLRVYCNTEKIKGLCITKETNLSDCYNILIQFCEDSKIEDHISNIQTKIPKDILDAVCDDDNDIIIDLWNNPSSSSSSIAHQISGYIRSKKFSITESTSINTIIGYLSVFLVEDNDSITKLQQWKGSDEQQLSAFHNYEFISWWNSMIYSAKDCCECLLGLKPNISMI